MAIEHIRDLLKAMVDKQASDLYLTYDSVPSLRIEDKIVACDSKLIDDEDLTRYVGQLLNGEQIDELRSTLELNVAINLTNQARFRVNVFRQQSHDGIVIRRVQTQIPTVESLLLPSLYADLAMEQRGLILLSGRTGSGKSTSLAAMIGHRNSHGEGHIITIEDPIEYVHTHNKCIVTQRDVGLDTYSYALALKNALRQRPDVVVIGEVRDREVMEQALYFAETGHLCIATIHANNASQTVERVLNFFPEDRHPQVLLNLSLNLKGVLSQRLMTGRREQRVLALEIMLNRGLIKQHIEQGKIKQLREMIEKGTAEGMQTFDQHLYTLWENRDINEDTALAEADSAANLRLAIQNKKASERGSMILADLGQVEETIKKKASEF